MYIKKIIFTTLLTLIISCGGNYTGNEEEMVNSVSFQLHPFLAEHWNYLHFKKRNIMASHFI